MKIKVLIFLLLPVCVFTKSIAQKISLSGPLKNLLADNKLIPSISWENSDYVSIKEYPFNTMPQNLIKNGNGLFVFVNSSGRLYQANRNGDSIEFNRIDSTIYFGYDCGSYPFSYNDSIYTLGGYGYWRINGQLRVFINQTKQWDIVKLNEEIPLLWGNSTDMIWYDTKDRKIFIGYGTIRDEAVKTNGLNEASYLYNVCALDLVTKDWQKLGTLSNYFREKKPLLKDITSSPWGQLAALGNKLIIIDYANNRVLSLKPPVEDVVNSLVAAAAYSNLYYFKDSTLFFGNIFKNNLDSIQLQLSDFIVSGEKIYTTDSSFSKNFLIFIGCIVIIGITILVIRNKRKKNKSLNEKLPFQSTVEKFQMKETLKAQTVYDEKELQLLMLIVNHSLQGRTTSVDELNNCLGVTRKNVEIQKKQRSDTIMSINKKYHFVTISQEDLIQKKRSEPDKRAFEYFIEYSKAKEVLDFLNKV